MATGQIVSSKFNSIVTTIGTVSILVLIVIGYFAWKRLSNENVSLQNEVIEFKKLTETLIRSSNKWVTKDDLEAQTKNLLTKEEYKVLKGDLNSLNSRLIAVGKTVGIIDGRVAILETSDNEGKENPNVEKCPDGRLIDTYGYTKNTQYKDIKDSKSAPVVNVSFDASKNKPWSYKVFRRDHKVVTAVGKKESGQLTFHNKLSYSVPEKDKEKWYSVDLISSNYVQVPSKNQMFWFNPTLDLNLFAGGKVYGFDDGSKNISSIGVDAGLSLSSYGETRADSWFRLFRVGAGYNFMRKATHFSVAPFAFNVGKPLPLLTNMYLTPQLGVDTNGGLTVNLGVGPQF